MTCNRNYKLYLLQALESIFPFLSSLARGVQERLPGDWLEVLLYLSVKVDELAVSEVSSDSCANASI